MGENGGKPQTVILGVKLGVNFGANILGHNSENYGGEKKWVKVNDQN